MNQNNLKNWGEQVRIVPERNAELKAQAMATFSQLPKKEKVYNSFRLPVFAFSSAMVVILAVVVYKVSDFSKPQEIVTSVPEAQQSIGIAESGPALAPQGTKAADAGAPSAKMAPNPYDAENRAYNLDTVQVDPQYRTNLQMNIPVTDNREFLKVSYSAKINSIKVVKVSDEIKSALKGYDGRIDSEFTSSDRAFISFAIPKTKLVSFKQQVESIAGAKFYEESTMSENLLPEKQALENQSAAIKDSLEELERQKDNLENQHKDTVASLNSQIAANNKQLADLNLLIAQNPMNADWQNQVQSLKTKIANLKNQLANENSSYDAQINWFEYEINNVQKNLDSVKKQDTNLVDSVATVTGTIVVNKINTVEYINTIFPFYYSIPLLLLLILVGYLFKIKKPIQIP